MTNLSPAIKSETRRVTACTLVGVVLMYIVFLALHIAFPGKVPFDYTVILGGLCGGIVAVLNFFLMGVTVQKVVTTQDQDLARSIMKGSYSRRMIMQMAWVVAAIVFPCFQFVAGIVPLVFPSTGIKLLGIFGGKKNTGAVPTESAQDVAAQASAAEQDSAAHASAAEQDSAAHASVKEQKPDTDTDAE